MSLNIEGVRPALISEDTFVLLDELRAFRHFFRHAYNYEIRYQKVKPLLDCIDQVRHIYKTDVQRFIKEIDNSL